MKDILVNCAWCKKSFARPKRQVNEAKKFGWKSYCSRTCQAESLNKSIVLRCSNSVCDKSFRRQPNDILSTASYCSQSCAATCNNRKYPKRKALIRSCIQCDRSFKASSRQVCCSRKCRDESQIITGATILSRIKKFYAANGRIPLKQEFEHYGAARGRFGTWNNAVVAAGFKPNPVMFANRYLANDGHECDSFTEKIIDDWLNAKGIAHKRRLNYPGSKLLSVDFVVGNKWIEFFGLAGELNNYDKLIGRKREICQKNKIKLIEIYPKDLFPAKKREEFLKNIFS